MKNLVIGSTNEGKVKEFISLLKTKLPEELIYLSLTAFPFIDEIEENGKSFFENAKIKAKTIMEAVALPVLADDSGLVIDALGGAPGIYSARYAQMNTTHSTRPTMDDAIALILEQMKNIPKEERTARFVCAICIANTDGKIWSAEGVWEGYIAFEKEGIEGFGYDPIFISKEHGIPVAMLSHEEKNSYSHRRKALNNLCSTNVLKELF